MNQFSFTLKENNTKAFNLFFWFLFFLHIIAACVIIINPAYKQHQYYAMGTIALFAIISFCFYLLKEKFKFFSYQILLFTLMVFFWPLQAAWWPALIMIAAIAFAYVLLKKKSKVVFADGGVGVSKSMFTKTYTWDQLDNAVLKDNLLSIDFKNNQLFQQEVEDNGTINEESFNKFCRKQIQTPNS
jgi:hypothetical protein